MGKKDGNGKQKSGGGKGDKGARASAQSGIAGREAAQRDDRSARERREGFEEIQGLIARIDAISFSAMQVLAYQEGGEKTPDQDKKMALIRDGLADAVQMMDDEAVRVREITSQDRSIDSRIFFVRLNELKGLVAEVLAHADTRPVVDAGKVQREEEKKPEPEPEKPKARSVTPPGAQPDPEDDARKKADSERELRVLEIINEMTRDMFIRRGGLQGQLKRAHEDMLVLVAEPLSGDRGLVERIRDIAPRAKDAVSKLDEIITRAEVLETEAHAASGRRRQRIVKQIDSLPFQRLEQHAGATLDTFYDLLRQRRFAILSEIHDIGNALRTSSSPSLAEGRVLIGRARAAVKTQDDTALMRLFGEMQALVRAPEPEPVAASEPVPATVVSRLEAGKGIQILAQEQRRLLGGFNAAADSRGTSPSDDDARAFSAEYPESRLVEIARILAVSSKNRDRSDLDLLREAREVFPSVAWGMSPEELLRNLEESAVRPVADSEPEIAFEPEIVREPIAEPEPALELAVAPLSSRDADLLSVDAITGVLPKDPGTALMVSGPTALTPYRRSDRIRRTRLPAASDRSNDASSSSDASAPVAATPMPDTPVRRMVAEPILDRDRPRRRLPRPPHDPRLLMIPLVPVRPDIGAPVPSIDLAAAAREPIPPTSLSRDNEPVPVEVEWEEEDKEPLSADLRGRKVLIDAILEHLSTRTVWRDDIALDLSEIEIPLFSLHSDAERRNYIRRQLLLNDDSGGVLLERLLLQARDPEALRRDMFDLIRIQLEKLTVPQMQEVLAAEPILSPRLPPLVSVPPLGTDFRGRVRVRQTEPGPISPIEERRTPRARGGVSERETKNESLLSRASNWLKKQSSDVYRVHLRGELTQAERQENAPTLSRQAMLAGGILSGILSHAGYALPLDFARAATQGIFVGRERKAIIDAVRETIARRRENVGEVAVSERLSERDVAVQLRIEKSRYLTDAQKRDILTELHTIMEKFDAETSPQDERLVREVGRIANHVIRPRVSGDKVKKEAVNTLLKVSGAQFLRAPAYGAMTIYERWSRLTRQSPESPAVYRLEATIVGGFSEWWNEARGSEGRIAQAAAIGTAARFVGMGAVGAETVGHLALGAFELAKDSEIVGNLLDAWKNIETAYSAFDAPKFLRTMFADVGHYVSGHVDVPDTNPSDYEPVPFVPEDTISDIVMAPGRIPVEAVVGDKGSITGTFLAAVDAHPDLLQGTERAALEDDYAAKLLVRRLAAKDGLLDYWLSEKAVGKLAIVPRYDTDGLHAAFLSPSTGSAYSIEELKDMGWLVKGGNA